MRHKKTDSESCRCDSVDQSTSSTPGEAEPRARRRARTPTLYPTEDEEQITLAVYLNRRFGRYGWIHVPNQRWAKVQYLKKLSAMGVKKGFPDILIFERVPYPDSGDTIRFVGMAIELKRQEGGRLSNEQEDWILLLQEQHSWFTTVAYGAQDAINKIKEIYGK